MRSILAAVSTPDALYRMGIPSPSNGEPLNSLFLRVVRHFKQKNLKGAVEIAAAIDEGKESQALSLVSVCPFPSCGALLSRPCHLSDPTLRLFCAEGATVTPLVLPCTPAGRLPSS